MPYGVTACLGRISVTGVASWMTTPSASTAAARPRTSLTGWMRAPCGVQVEPTAPATRIRRAVSAAPYSSRSLSPYPSSPSWKDFSRINWAGV